MNHKAWAIGLCVAATFQWLFPQWNGIVFEAVNVTAGESRIISSIFFSTGLLLWFLTPEGNRSKKDIKDT